MIITITILLFSHIHVRHIEPNWTCSWARFTLVANRNGNAFTFHWTTYDTKCIEHEVYELFSRQWLSVYSLDRNSICFFVYGRISLYVCLHVLTPNSVRWNSNNSNTVYVTSRRISALGRTGQVTYRKMFDGSGPLGFIVNPSPVQIHWWVNCLLRSRVRVSLVLGDYELACAASVASHSSNICQWRDDGVTSWPYSAERNWPLVWTF